MLWKWVLKRLISVLSQRDERVLSLTFTQMGKSFEMRSLLTNKAMLGAYNHLIDSLLKAHIKEHLSDEFVNVCRKLSKQIAFIQRVRNPAAHTEYTSFEQANNLRARLVGVATQSVLVIMIKARTQLLKEWYFGIFALFNVLLKAKFRDFCLAQYTLKC